MSNTLKHKSLKQRQQQLMAYLLNRNGDISNYIVQQGAIDIQTRLEIYHNAYRVRLRETLETDHPVTGIYLGDDLFERMAEEYIKHCPSHVRSLRQFADDLPSFLTQHLPFKEHPEIAEIARFERLLLTAFDALDTPRIGLPQLQALVPEVWPSMSISFHPSVQLFDSQWNAVEIWQAIKAGRPPPSPVNHRSTWLLWRNGERLTEFRALQDAEFITFKHFLIGHSYAEVCEALLEQLPEEQISAETLQFFVHWLDQGIVHRLHVKDEY